LSDLWERLQRARSLAPAPASEAPPAAEEAPPGWRWHTPLVAYRTVEFPFDPDFVRALGVLDWFAWKGTFCLDVEATGLSGGAGTTAFLIGWAEAVPGPAARVTQWFLRDHPGEADLVAAVDRALGEAQTLVSFNGASYDLPLLKTRWTLTGRSFPERPHRDDLHPARRLWKRLLESCRLSRLEEAVLGMAREDDVPGALVPELWYGYLRSGAPARFDVPLDGVLRHHAQDVYSLLCLDLLMAALRADPESPRWQPSFGAFPTRRYPPRPAAAGLFHPDLGPGTPVDFWGLSETLDDEPKERGLRDAWDSTGFETVGLAWARRLKQKNDPQARDVWTALWQRSRSYPALLELLKWLEHRDKTPEARAKALALINEAFDAPFLPKVWREDLEHRRLRLSSKTDRSEFLY
jgi:hypothetical protein